MYTPYKDSASLPEDPVLFSERFERIYHLLGTFGTIYVCGNGRSIGKEELLREGICCDAGDEETLHLLTTHHLLVECEGGFLLNESLFFRMTLWDLLVICEPWLSRPPCGKSTDGRVAREYRKFREFGRCQNLSRTYLMRIDAWGSS